MGSDPASISPSVSHQSLNSPQPTVNNNKKRCQTVENEEVVDKEEDGAFFVRLEQVNVSRRKL